MSLPAMLAAIAGVTASVSPAPEPITLAVREGADAVHLVVTGRSDTPYAARYALEVAGQGPAGTNRTTQGGSATLRPGETATLLSVTLGTGGAGGWAATLTVTPAKGAPYRREYRSATPPKG